MMKTCLVEARLVVRNSRNPLEPGERLWDQAPSWHKPQLSVLGKEASRTLEHSSSTVSQAMGKE